MTIPAKDDVENVSFKACKSIPHQTQIHVE